MAGRPEGVTLAAALARAERGLRAAESEVQALLTSLFPAWKGWTFTTPDGIDVYQAPYTPRAAAVLFRHGFKAVTLHDHRAERYLSCACKTHEPTGRVDPRTL